MNKKFIDLYEILGVEPNANQERIKKQFHRQAKIWHPDVNDRSDAKEKFIGIYSAYQILSDQEKREEYNYIRDAYLHDELESQKDMFTSKWEHYDSWYKSANETSTHYANVDYEQFIEDVISKVYEAGKVLVKGEENIRSDISFGDRLSIGCFGTLLILLIVATFAGLYPITFPILILFAIIGKRTFQKDGKFVGVSTVFEGLLIFLFIIVLPIILLIFAFLES